MRTISLEEAETNLRQLLEAPERDTIFVIVNGRQVASISPALTPSEAASEPAPKRRLGFAQGKWEIPDDFDTMFEKEIEEMFYGEEEE